MAPSGRWRSTLKLMEAGAEDSTIRRVHEAVAHRESRIRGASAALDRIRDEFREAAGSHRPMIPGMAGLEDGVMPWMPLADPRSTSMRAALDNAFADLQGALAECLPQSRDGGNHSRSRATAAWSECIFQLRAIKTRLKDASRAPGGLRNPMPAVDLARAQAAWSRGREVQRWHAKQRGLRGLGTRASLATGTVSTPPLCCGRSASGSDAAPLCAGPCLTSGKREVSKPRVARTAWRLCGGSRARLAHRWWRMPCAKWIAGCRRRRLPNARP